VLGGGLVILLNWWLVDLDALSLNDSSNSSLELGEIGWAERVGLGDNGDQVDARAEPLHDLNV